METLTDTIVSPESRASTRRNFLIGAIHAIWALIAIVLAGPASAYLLLAPKIRKTDEWIDAGDVSKLSGNQPIQVALRRNRIDGWKVGSEKLTAWVVKTPSGSVVAFGPQCTHLGCAHHWDEGKHQFVCPCHNSLFSIEGKVVAGPAPRPLDRFDLKIQSGRLWLGSLRKTPKDAV